MKAAPPIHRSIVLILCLAILAACTPAAPTPMGDKNVEIVNINVNEPVIGQLIQTKTFDQCSADSPITSVVKFGDNASETSQSELTLSAGATVGADVPVLAKAELEASIQARFASIKQSGQSHEESVTIFVPAHTRQEYTIVWRETRREGTIEYMVGGEPQVAYYSYRVGLESASSTGRNLDCLPTATATVPLPPTPTPVPAGVATSPPSLTVKTLAQGCIFARTWKPDSADARALGALSTGTDGCTSMEPLGIFVNQQGALHLSNETQKTPIAAGIYTPIQGNSIIEFTVHVDSMYVVHEGNQADIIFAITPANDRLTARSTARFKLHLEDPGHEPIIHFVMADAGEYEGIKLGTQHYEYGQTYTIRLELVDDRVQVFINNYLMLEKPKIPAGPKAFYIGYDLPIYAGTDIEVKNIKVDGITK